jgi:hypothetical protein
MADKKQSNAIYLLDDDSFARFIKRLRETKDLTGQALDMIVAEVAAKGRRLESEEEARKVHLGGESYKRTFDYSNKKWNTASYGGSVWNQKLGGYVPARAGHITRLINFSYETKANIKRGGNGRFAKASVSSQVFNLFAQDTKAYKKNSPWFMNTQNDSKWMSIRQGVKRKAKFNLSDFKQNVERAIPRALEAGERKYQELLDELDKEYRR